MVSAVCRVRTSGLVRITSNVTIERDERLPFLPEPLNALAGEGPLRIVWIGIASFRGNAMTNQVQLELFGHHELLRARTLASG